MARVEFSQVRSLTVVGVAVLAWFGATRPVSAQVVTGTVEGRVKDSQGGVLPGVTITAVNTGTAASFVAATTSDGLYDSFSVDFALVRSIPTFGTQRAQVRLEVFNLFGNHYAGTPTTSFAIPDNFGRVFGTNGNRSWQIGMRYDW